MSIVVYFSLMFVLMPIFQIVKANMRTKKKRVFYYHVKISTSIIFLHFYLDVELFIKTL